MGGGLMQLVAYGAQDVYLTGNPQITFWKVTYRRHTNYAMESSNRPSTVKPTSAAESPALSRATVTSRSALTFRSLFLKLTRAWPAPLPETATLASSPAG